MINAVGIDVSKGFSTVAVVDSLGEVTVSPFNVNHTVSELGTMADKLKRLRGETKVVMEATDNYYLPIANALHAAGLKVYAVNPILIKNFGNNAVHKHKSDKADARKNVTATMLSALMKFMPPLKNALLLYRITKLQNSLLQHRWRK